MSNDALNILPEGNDAERNDLLSQLNNELNISHSEDLFAEDADEGLKKLKKEDADKMVQQLDAGLTQHLKKKKTKRKGIPDLSGTYIIIATLLLLIIISYIVIKKIYG